MTRQDWLTAAVALTVLVAAAALFCIRAEIAAWLRRNIVWRQSDWLDRMAGALVVIASAVFVGFVGYQFAAYLRRGGL